MRRAWGLCLAFASLACTAGDEPAVYVVEARDAEAQGDSGASYKHIPGRRPVSGGVSSADAGDTPSGEPSTSGQSCSDDLDCGAGAVCYQGTCVGEGALRFSLSWDLDTDYDLHVMTPGGVHISYSQPSAAGGVLDVDDCVASICRVAGGTHVENIFFAVAPASGVYEYWADNFSGELTGRFELEVSADGRVVATKSGTLPLLDPAESPHYTYDY